MAGLFNDLRKLLFFLASLPKSLLFNFRYLPPAQAARLPILVSWRLKLRRMGGRIHLGKRSFGAVRIGFNSLGMVAGCGDALWDVTGEVRFEGSAHIGCHPMLQIRGRVVFGDNFDAGHHFKLFCEQEVRFGRDTLLSWNVEVMDNDGHVIEDTGAHRRINPPAPVEIGERCWVGCHSLILKGSRLPDGCVLAARSLLNASFDEPNSLLAGMPATIRKHNIIWQT